MSSKAPSEPADEQKTREQLLRELAELRARLAAVKDESLEDCLEERLTRKRAEEALQDSERRQREFAVSAEVERARLEAVLANLPVGVWIADRNGKLVGKNEAADRIWVGNAPLVEGIESYSRYAAWHSGSGKKLTPEEYPVAKALLTDSPAEAIELDIQRLDGTTGTVLASAAPIRNSDGVLVGAVGINVDLTERKLAERRLRRNRDTFYHLIQNNPFGVYVVDADFKLRQVSLGAQKVFSNVRPLLGRDFAEVLRLIWSEPFASEAIARFRHTLETGEPYVSYSTIEQRRDIDESEAYDWRIERVVLPDGRFGVVCYFYDLSERRRLEEALRESEARYRNLFNTMLEGFCVIEMVFDESGKPVDYKFVEANAVFEEQSGLRDVLGKSVRELVPDNEEYWFQTFGQVALTGEPVRLISETKGLGRWYDVYAYRLGDTASRQVAVMFNNITERKEAEEALRRLNETLEQQVAERTAVAEQRTEQLRALALELTKAEEQVRRRIADLLHDDLQQLLTAARYQLSALRTTLQSNPTAGVAVQEVDKLLSQSIQKSRHLSHELSPAILHHSGLVAALEWLVRGMEERYGLLVTIQTEDWTSPEDQSLDAFLFRAIQELLLNVVKHAASKNADVRLHSTEHQAVVLVSDSGKGFDPGDLEKPKKTGDGFGLFSIRERVRHIGGDLIIESSAGKGSRIALTLPVKQRGEPKWNSSQPAKERYSSAPRDHFIHPQPRYRVLVVDDHPMMRRGLIAVLENHSDIQVVGEATNGREALEMTRTLHPDVVVMDVVMPEMDGIEATQAIKREMPSVRVIGLSMLGDNDVAERLKQAGAEAYVNKENASQALLDAIR